MHRWGASVFIILLFFHMARVFLYGAYKYPRELNWIIGVLLLILGMFEGFTGYLLPFDQTAYWATVVGMNITANGPFVGGIMAQILQGGPEIGGDTLSRFYSLHMLVAPGLIFALIGLHLYLVIRLGVSSPPWSKEAAGADYVEPSPSRRRAPASSRRPPAGGRHREHVGAEAVRPPCRRAARSSRATRGTSRSGGSRSSRTRCSTTR